MQNSNLYLMTKVSLYFSFTIYYHLLFIYYLLSLFIIISIYYLYKLFHVRFMLVGTVFTSPFSNLINIVNPNLAIAINVIYQCI